ncbi:hypothetical protein ETH_00014340, partial [Eimeria tenella]
IASAQIHPGPVVGLSGLESRNSSSSNSSSSSSSSSSSKLLSACADGTIRLLDASNLQVLSGGRLTKRLGGISLTTCFYDRDKEMAYLGTTAGVLLVYNVAVRTPQFVAEAALTPSEPIAAFAADPDVGTFVGHGPQVSLLQLAANCCRRKSIFKLRENGEKVFSFDFAKRQKRLVVGYQSFVALWSIDTGECLLAWAAHNGGIYQLLTHENGKFLISGGDSGTIKMWQMPPDSELTPWCVHTPQQHFGDEEEEENYQRGFAAANEVSLRQQQQQREQRGSAAAHGDWGAATRSRNVNPVLLKRYSSSSEEEDYAEQQREHQQQQQQQQQQQPQQQLDEPPLLVEQEEDSSDEELDDIRSALA